MKDEIKDQKLPSDLQSITSSLSVFYELLKIHKSGYSSRPITSIIGSYQYNLLKYSARTLKNALSALTRMNAFTCVCRWNLEKRYVLIRARNQIELSDNSTRIDSTRPNRIGPNWLFRRVGRIESGRMWNFRKEIESDRIEL
jgi:hypothetical protein